MKKYFQKESIFNGVFKNVPASILGMALIFALMFTANSYTGVRGIKLNTLFIVIGVIFFEILLIMAYKKFMNCTEKIINIIIIIELAILCIGLIITGYFIQINDIYDFEYMHMSAMSYANNGFWGHSLYFSKYPKQRNWTVILGLVYKLEKLLDINDYRIGGTIIGIILTFMIVYFSGKTIKILLGKKAEAISLLFLIFNPIFYVYVSFYYKDIPGPMCEVLVLYFVLKGGVKRNSNKYYILAGMIAGIGCFILKSVVIGLIAASVYIIFSNMPNKIQKIAVLGGSFIGMLFLLSYGIDIFYKWDLDKNKKYPLVHWLLLGLYGDGTYSREISDFTNSFFTLEEKTKEDLLKIVEVVKSNGFSGMLQLWISKQCTIFGNGLAGITRLSNYVGDYNFLWRYSLGPKRLFMEYYAQIYRCIILMNCLCAIIQILKNKFDRFYLFFICIFGHMLYHSFFETKDKYILTFLPILIILSVIGFTNLAEKVKIVSKEHISIISSEINIKIKCKTASNLCIVLSLLSLLILFSSFKPLFKEVSNETALRAANKGYNMAALPLCNEKVIGQTFRCRQSFNSIELRFNTDEADKNAIYKFELLDSNNKTITSSEFNSNHINNEYIQFNFDEVKPDGWEYYTIQVFALNESDSYISIYGTRMDGEDDFYNYGEAIGTDGYINDLYFVVNEKYYNVPYYPMSVFVLVLGIILIMEGIPIVRLYDEFAGFRANGSGRNKRI